MRNRLPGGVVSAFESAEAAQCADPIDEYRELAMLAHAWELGTLEPRAAKPWAGRSDDAEGKEPPLR